MAKWLQISVVRRATQPIILTVLRPRRERGEEHAAHISPHASGVVRREVREAGAVGRGVIRTSPVEEEKEHKRPHKMLESEDSGWDRHCTVIFWGPNMACNARLCTFVYAPPRMCSVDCNTEQTADPAL